MTTSPAQERLIEITKTVCLASLEKTLNAVYASRSIGYSVAAARCSVLAERMCRDAVETGMVLDRKWMV